MGWFQSDKFSQIILVEIRAFMEFFMKSESFHWESVQY